MRRFSHSLLFVLFAIVGGPVAAQDASWPSRPIRYVVPFAPGGTTDILARLVAQKLASSIGQPVVVDNKPGAGGNIGSDFVAKAAPDGYTILGGTISSHAINPSMYANMPYDAVKSFAPITLIGSLPNVLIVHPDFPARTVQEFIAAAKAKPGSITYASSGQGTSQHLSGELFESLTGTALVHIPYRGGGPALQDVLAGQVNASFENFVAAAPHIKAGKVRALGVTSTARVKGYEDIPTIAESGVRGFDVVSWQGVFAPAGTPRPIIERFNAEIVKILKMPDVRERMAAMGLEPVGNAPEEFAAFQRAEIAKWAKVVKAANIKAE